MTALLTPQEVADLLSVSLRAIYDNHERLGGFYPAGIKRLRFRREVSYGIMEGQEAKGLVLQVRSAKEDLRKPGLLNQKRCHSSQGGASAAGIGKYRTDPKKHGL